MGRHRYLLLHFIGFTVVFAVAYALSLVQRDEHLAYQSLAVDIAGALGELLFRSLISRQEESKSNKEQIPTRYFFISDGINMLLLPPW